MCYQRAVSLERASANALGPAWSPEELRSFPSQLRDLAEVDAEEHRRQRFQPSRRRSVTAAGGYGARWISPRPPFGGPRLARVPGLLGDG